MSNLDQLIDSLIEKNQVMIFTKSSCYFCNETKSTLKTEGVDFQDYSIDHESKGQEVHQLLKKRTSQNTVPYVFINQKLIGGNSDLQKLVKSNQLASLLRKAAI